MLLALWRRRRWFGVEERRTWRTLWREGAPALLVTALLDGSILVSLWLQTRS
jgi:hypothetical protein